MGQIKSYRELKVWEKSSLLCEEIYKVTEKLPPSEKFCLSSQMRRAAISIPSNIAEGSKRSPRELIRFLRIADGSAAELETQMKIAAAHYTAIDFKVVLELITEVQKMLYVLIAHLVKRMRHKG